MKTIVFTGGGSGGHVIPAITLIKELSEFRIFYIGGKKSIERSLVSELPVTYFPIHTGKLRRYLSKENITDVFKVLWGTLQALRILFFLKRKDTVIFSTGGFVSVPVVIAGWLTRKTIYIHEQTTRVGLANKIASVFADKVFISFKESRNFFPKHKTFLSGYPVRKECFKEEVREVKLDGQVLNQIDRPILFVTGGGNGSLLINELIKKNIEQLKTKYCVIHQVGKNYVEEYSALKDENYIPVDFVGDGMIDLFKLAQVVISRAGAGTVCELLALKKRSIFIPLKIAQKSEQLYNAKEAGRILKSTIITEDEIDDLDLISVLAKFENAETATKSEVETTNGVDFLCKAVLERFFSQS